MSTPLAVSASLTVEVGRERRFCSPVDVISGFVTKENPLFRLTCVASGVSLQDYHRQRLLWGSGNDELTIITFNSIVPEYAGTCRMFSANRYRN